MPPKSKVKEQVKPVQGFYATYACQLPVWDDDQILTENWGTGLSAVSGGNTSSSSKESKQTKSKEGGLTGNCFVDLEGRLPLARFIERHLPSDEPPPSPTPGTAEEASESEKKNSFAKETVKKGKGDKKDKNEAPDHDSAVVWHRPVDVSKPFRPVVHRNATPYVNPYATGDELVPIDAREEEAKYRAEAALAANTGKKGDNQKAETGGPLFELYPETVSLMEDLVGQSATRWQGISCDVAVARYREIPPLMEPYDPTLISGCAETPAEACGSRYSTALRHKLQRAETLEALRKIPPFLMSAFNSVLLVLERVQHMIPAGNYVWELIHPHAPGTCHPVYNPYGKYAVKLFVEGSYRKVIVDDALPVDELGRPLITVTSLRELWPAILVKAIFKAFGHDAARFFTDDPDLLIPCLMGNYIPQHIYAKNDMLSATALLLTYKMQLKEQERKVQAAATAQQAALQSPERRTTPHNEKTDERSAEKLAGHNDPSPPPSSRKRSLSKKSAKKEVVPTNGVEKLMAEEHEAPNDDEPLDKKPRLLCGLRTSRTDPPPPGFGSGVQLFAITDVVSFRNTLAVRVETTPRTDLSSGLFELEREAKDVRHILMGDETSKNPNLTEVWLTLEEFSDVMDSIVVWRFFDHRYLHQVSVEYDASNIAIPVAGGGGGKKGAAAAAAAGPPVVWAPKKHIVAWVSLTSDRPEEVAIVAYGPIPPPPLTPEEEAAAAELANPKKAPPHAKQSKPANPKKGTAAVVESPPPPEASVTLNFDSGASTGCPTSWVQYESYRKESKLIQLEYYQYDLSDPLTQSVTATYEYGKLSSTIFKLKPGTHLFQVTIPEMEYGDKVTFVSDAKMEVQSQLSDALKGVMVHNLSDAGVYPPIEQPNNESLWFKRKIRVAIQTTLSIVLSTLLPTENPAHHRNVSTANTQTKGVKNAAGGGGNSSRGGGAAGRAAGQAPAGEELDLRRCDVPIVKYTTVLLINLDNREDTLVGSGGHLIQITVEPNKNGYLLVAYACVPGSEVPKIRAGYENHVNSAVSNHGGSQDGVESGNPVGVAVTPSTAQASTNALSTTPSTSGVQGGVGSSPAGSTPPTSNEAVPPGALYGRGLWKVSVRSNNELAAFEALTHSAHVVTDSNTLERGGGAVFFRYTCTLTEPTHLSLVAETVESFNIPVTFSIRHYYSVPAAASSSGKGAAEPQTMELPEDMDACVYRSPPEMKHLFIPDVLLELMEKAKSTTYLIEGTVPEDKAEAWDEYCRQAQEDKFHLIRAEAQRMTEERHHKEWEEATTDPNGFIQQKVEEQQLQQQQLLALEADRANKEGNNNAKRNRSVDRRKPQAQNPRRSSRLNSLSHESTQKTVSSTAASTLLGSLDTVDKDLHITHHVQLISSNPKTELKNALPQEDCLALLRQHWREGSNPPPSGTPAAEPTGAATQRPPSAPVNAKTTSPMSSKTSRQQQQQREQAAAEELLRSEQGRQSRLQFIENPLNVLVPYVQIPEEAVGRSHPKSQPTIIAEDSEENNFQHAMPLAVEDYRIRLLPMRAYEMTPPTVVETALLAPSASNAFAGGVRENRRGRNGAGSKAATPPSSQWNPAAAGPQWEEDETQLARGPLIQLTERLTDICRERREDQKKGRKEIKKRIYHFWSVKPSQTEEGTSPAGIYPSLIGNRDDDSAPVKRGKA